jgi:hypothetical protein
MGRYERFRRAIAVAGVEEFEAVDEADTEVSRETGGVGSADEGLER